MFLTERQGGSDVGANSTRAVRDGNEWRLHGEKHFCSNVDAEIFIVLARPDGAPEGPGGLATFIVPRLRDDGTVNGFRIRRLKPKLGTRGVPTAEVSLDGAVAWLASERPTPNERSQLSERGHRGGLGRMMEMVNGSRFGVALMGLGIHRRSFLEAAIYAAHREQWGQRIDRYPMVRETLVDLLVTLEGGLALTFECAAATRTARSMKTKAVDCGASWCRWPRCGQHAMALAPRPKRSRSSGATDTWRTGRWRASCGTRSATRSGKGPRTSVASTSGARSGATPRTKRCSLASNVSSTASARAPALASVVDAVALTLDDARAAVDYLEGAATDLQLLHARRLTFLLADLMEGALLIDEATWALTKHGDAAQGVGGPPVRARAVSRAPRPGHP